jgi:Raf kinase inhibitor-like YbhB/YbcL family protein
VQKTHLFVLAALAVAACRSTSTAPPAAADVSKLGVSSDVYKDGGAVPLDSVYAKSGCSGKNLSPNVRIDPTSIPTATKSFALLLHDPDAPGGGFYHWVMFDIPASARSIEGSRPASDTLPDGSIQGTNDFDDRGYGGPCPPSGKPHRYKLTVYALDVAKLGLDSSARGSDIARAMDTHILAAGTITSTYGR